MFVTYPVVHFSRLDLVSPILHSISSTLTRQCSIRYRNAGNVNLKELATTVKGNRALFCEEIKYLFPPF